ncbi:hypothetical protein [Shewanella youngdeokensis]|uniref:Uncharacterized protein n=1 Tax=Shewanella youngdeokensis TaxID=2999068 RepID=A0ABZ0JVD2_9GAMM|nr:hypothetical protein RGE70_12520 [Shewanella sp. DAU334]
MKHVTEQWKSRSLIIMVISLVVCALLWTLSLTDWAAAMNVAVSEPHEKPDASALMIGVVSLVKVMVLTLVPAALCLGILRIINMISRFIKVRIHSTNA